MADESKHFTWPSQFQHDGVTFFNFINPRVVKDQEIVKCREDDVFVASYPKSGTTVMIEMVSLLMNGADITANLSSPQPARVPMVEMYYKQMTRYGWFYLLLNRILTLLLNHTTPSVYSMGDAGPPQFIRRSQSHRTNTNAEAHQNPPTVQVIPETSSSEKLQVCYGDWFNHVLEWWDHKDDSNILFLKYEDLKKNPREVLRDTARFLDVRVTEEMEDVILEHCSFRKMKENKAVNFDQSRSFIRKGVIGDWRNNFTVAQNKEFEKMYQERMKGTDLDFEW
ncbi:sulfotransferase 1B1-like [Ptychodera flava]|uniref:sulfotransferase 1B1-like n=1 Tax=Ptychodera flava TaxID=63121 RepID=UPI003969EF8B